jgi:hypothetical protein
MEREMSQERHRILQMLADGKVSVDEATQLLDAAAGPAGPLAVAAAAADGPRRGSRQVKYLRITVDEGGAGAGGKGAERVDIRVPIKLLRAGMRLGSLMPGDVGEKVGEALSAKGINLNLDVAKLAPDDVEELIDGLADLSIDVDEGKQKVRIRCE